MRWSHAALNCRDLDVTEDFYTTYFGFKRAHSFDLGDLRIVFLRLGDAYLELFGGKEPAPAPDDAAGGDGPQAPGTVRHLAFQVDDVDAQLAAMGDRADPTLGPLDFSEHIHGWRSVWLRDPDGVIVEISQGYHDADA
jgi:glyoxylase I family protein